MATRRKGACKTREHCRKARRHGLWTRTDCRCGDRAEPCSRDRALTHEGGDQEATPARTPAAPQAPERARSPCATPRADEAPEAGGGSPRGQVEQSGEGLARGLVDTDNYTRAREVDEASPLAPAPQPIVVLLRPRSPMRLESA